MVSCEITIKNRMGIHVRPAQMLADVSSSFKSDIKLCKDGVEVNCKSILEILSLAAGPDTVLVLKAEGEDEAAAVEAIKNLVEVKKFNEE